MPCRAFDVDVLVCAGCLTRLVGATTTSATENSEMLAQETLAQEMGSANLALAPWGLGWVGGLGAWVHRSPNPKPSGEGTER